MRKDARVAALEARPKSSAPLVMVTAYDYPSALIAEAAGVDLVLVGDSAATTVLGYGTTREISIDELLVLTRAVRRGIQPRTTTADGKTGPLLIGDLPYGSYEESAAQAVATARRFADAGCDLVKLEGARAIESVQAIIAAGIPVIGHVGLLPQGAASADELRARGRTAAEAIAIVEDAAALADAGCSAIIVEAVPSAVGAAIAKRVRVPVIGIGAGADVDGQVLVYHDLLGLTDGHVPKFVRRYAELRETAVAAIESYALDVRQRRYPSESEGYRMPADELAAFAARTAGR